VSPGGDEHALSCSTVDRAWLGLSGGVAVTSFRTSVAVESSSVNGVGKYVWLTGVACDCFLDVILSERRGFFRSCESLSVLT
jgi:hypothetical protein